MKRVEGEFTVGASPREVLDFCGDLRNVLPALPGLLEVKEATAEEGTVLIDAGVSFVKGRFTVRIERTSRVENGLRFKGHGDGAGNAVDFESELDVAASDVDTTNVHWASEVKVHGPLASMGAGLLNPVINQNVELFVQNLKLGLEGVRPEVEAGAGAAQSADGLLARILALLSRLVAAWMK